MKKKLITRTLSLVLASIMLLSLVGCGSGEKTGTNSGDKEGTTESGALKFTMSLVDNEQSNYYKGAKAIAEEVKAATDGKITIDIKAGGTLGGEADTLDMAIQGDLDIASAANSVLANYIPEMNILDQAFLWDSQEQANYAITHELGDLIQAEAEKQGIKIIGYLESGFRDVFSKKPILKMEDFKGVKIRVMQNDGQLQAFKAFGANPVAISAGEQFTALQQNTIDACENAISNCLVNKFYEAGVTSISETHHSFVYIPLCMSKKAWDKIPEDLREGFLEAVAKGCEKQWGYLTEANDAAKEELQSKHGVTVSAIDTTEMKEAYKKEQEASGTKYNEEWVKAIEKAKEAVK